MAMRSWKLGLATAILASFGATAHGGLLPLSASVFTDGDNYRYTYGVMLTSNSILKTGDQFVIYDFAGFVPGSNDQPPNFAFSTQDLGGNPGRTMPNDIPDLANLVWTYTGDVPLVGQIGLGNFSAMSTNPESNVLTDFVSRSHVEDPSGETRVQDNITSTRAPSGGRDTDRPDLPTDPEPPVDEPPPVDPPSGVPEPSTMLLLAAGLPLAAGARFLRKRMA